jgi:hypothetical protein
MDDISARRDRKRHQEFRLAYPSINLWLKWAGATSMHDTTTHAVLRTSNDTRKPAPLRATASINGAEYSPPTRVDVSFNDETLSVDRAQLVLFCKEYLELDERIDRTHAILKDTHKQIRDLSVKIESGTF